MKLEAKAESDPKFRINIKQSAKGYHQWDVTVRADTKGEVQRLLYEASGLAQQRCNELNPVEEGAKE